MVVLTEVPPLPPSDIMKALQKSMDKNAYQTRKLLERLPPPPPTQKTKDLLTTLATLESRCGELEKKLGETEEREQRLQIGLQNKDAEIKKTREDMEPERQQHQV